MGIWAVPFAPGRYMPTTAGVESAVALAAAPADAMAGTAEFAAELACSRWMSGKVWLVIERASGLAFMATFAKDAAVVLVQQWLGHGLMHRDETLLNSSQGHMW